MKKILRSIKNFILILLSIPFYVGMSVLLFILFLLELGRTNNGAIKNLIKSVRGLKDEKATKQATKTGKTGKNKKGTQSGDKEEEWFIQPPV